ncbi:phospholipase A2 [Nocardioides sp. cx-173]|uniref:phospholipase A2 n=1 Tax=Nocardioides sp. cx-173 TaxID=2898796 RepID=UPI0035B4F5DC
MARRHGGGEPGAGLASSHTQGTRLGGRRSCHVSKGPPMKRLLLTTLAALTCLAGVWLPAPVQAAGPPPAAAYTQAQLRARANTLMFEMTLAQFMRVKNTAKSGIDTEFDWTDDGCSGPPNPFSDNFRRSCVRHDFGFATTATACSYGPRSRCDCGSTPPSAPTWTASATTRAIPTAAALRSRRTTTS